MSLPLQYLWTIASFKICPSHCNFIVPLHLSSYGHHFAKSKYHCFLKLYLGTVSSCKMWYFGMFASFKTCSSNCNSLAPLHLSRYVHMSFQDLSHIFYASDPRILHQNRFLQLKTVPRGTVLCSILVMESSESIMGRWWPMFAQDILLTHVSGIWDALYSPGTQSIAVWYDSSAIQYM